MAQPQYDFFSDLETIQQVGNQPEQLDFFSDLEQLQAQPKTVPFTQQAQQPIAQQEDFFSDLEALPEQKPKTPVEKKQSGLLQSFKKGLSESVSGELQQQIFKPETQEQIVQDPTFWESLVKESGTVVGDLPYLAAGATLGGILGSPGGPIGATVGAGFGATALPAFLKESIKQYRDFQEKGGDLTFGEFLQRADKIANRTLNEGLFGVILGSVKKAMPLLEKAPGIGKLFTSKAGKIAGTVTTEAAVATAIPAAAQGRLPEKEDFAKALALFAGFNLAHLPFEAREAIQEQGKSSGLTPEEFVKKMPKDILTDIKELADKNILENAQKRPISSEIAETTKDTAKPEISPKKATTEAETHPALKDVPQEIFRGHGREKKESAYSQVAKPVFGEGKYYAFNEESAKEYGPKVEAKKLDLKNPLVIRNDSEWKAFTKEAGLEYPNPTGRNASETEANIEKIQSVIGKSGHDGVVVYWEPESKYADLNKQGQSIKTLSKVFDVPQVFELPQVTASEKAVQRISAAKPKELSITANEKPEFKVPEPVIETTGEGARARIEYPKQGMDKIIDKMNSFIEQAKTPAESLKRYSESANTAIFNALAPLEKLEKEIPIHERPSTRIKLAKSAASEINSVLENGIFSNITGNFEHGGLKEAYGDLAWKKLSKGLKPHEYSIEDLDVYRTSKIALKRQREGKKTGIDTQQAKEDIKRLINKYEPIDQRIRQFQKATLETYGKDLLGKDLIEKWNKEYYSPLYRVMEEGKDSTLSSGSLKPKQPFKKMKGSERKIIPPSESDSYNTAMIVRNARKNDAVLQYMKLVQQGKLPGKITKAKLEPISERILEELDISKGLKPIAEQLYNQTRTSSFTPEKNIIRGWKDGKAFDIEVPSEIYDIFSTLAPQERSVFTKFFSAVNRLFSRGISLEPRKFLSIMSRDALSSLIYSRTGSNPVSVFEALSDVWRGAPVYKEFLSLGGDVYASKLAERIDRAKKIEDLITPGKEGILVPFEKMGDYFRKYSQALSDISIAVPLAEYKRALEKFGNTPEGRLMAAMEARRVTYDPTRKGSSKIVQGLGNYIPFWNVSLQDVSMLGQNLKRPEAWMKGIAAVTIPTLLLKMANEGNPDYEDLTPIDKAAFWHIYSGDKHFRIPIPWLLGTTFKVGAEAFYDQTLEMLNKGDYRAKDAWEGLYEHFVENISGAVPPALQIYMEQTTGKTAPSPLGLFLGTESRAPEVVPKRLQGLEPKHQYTSKTSILARKWGELWNVSPVKVDRFIKGLGTTSASSLLALTDEIAYYTGLAEDKRPEQREANYLLLGHFVSNSPSSRTKYQNEFYDYLREAEQRKRSQKLIREKGLQESLEDLSFQKVPLGKYQRQISKLFREMRAAEDDPKVSASVKKSYLNSKQIEINNLYKEAVLEVRRAEKSK